MPVWLNTTLLGLGTVFFGLICLIFITKLMSAIINASQKQDKAAAAPAPVAAVAPAAPAAPAIPDRAAFVAAVASSIATVMGTDVSGLRIHSIKKAN